MEKRNKWAKSKKKTKTNITKFIIVVACVAGVAGVASVASVASVGGVTSDASVADVGVNESIRLLALSSIQFLRNFSESQCGHVVVYTSAAPAPLFFDLCIRARSPI